VLKGELHAAAPVLLHLNALKEKTMSVLREELSITFPALVFVSCIFLLLVRVDGVGRSCRARHAFVRYLWRFHFDVGDLTGTARL
jgi:hypothetical protein